MDRGRQRSGKARRRHASPIPLQSGPHWAPPSRGGSQAARVTLTTGRLPLQDQLAVFSSHPCCAPPGPAPPLSVAIQASRTRTPSHRHRLLAHIRPEPSGPGPPRMEGAGGGRAGPRRVGWGPSGVSRRRGGGRIGFGRERFCLASGVCNANPTDLQHSLNLSEGDF